MIMKTPLLQILDIYKIVLPRINFKWEMKKYKFFFGEPEDPFLSQASDNHLLDKAHRRWRNKLLKNPVFYAEIMEDLLSLINKELKQNSE